MRKKTMVDKDNTQYSQYHECDALDLIRQGFRQGGSALVEKDREKVEKDIRKFHDAGDVEAFYKSCQEFERLTCHIYFILGEYEKIFERLLYSQKFFHYSLTVSDCFYTYCWISDSLISFILNNKDIKISHNVIVDIYDQERKKLNSVFEEFLKKFTVIEPENNGPVSETIEYLIKKNKLLPEPDPITKKYIATGSTPDIVAWIKLNNLHDVFPPALFHAMINTKCKERIIKKYYRDM